MAFLSMRFGRLIGLVQRSGRPAAAHVADQRNGIEQALLLHVEGALLGAEAGGLYIPGLLRWRYDICDPNITFARTEGEARASGFDLDLSRQLWAYPTRTAHAVTLAVAGRNMQYRLAVAITHAYSIAANNIFDADWLADIAAEHSFDRDQARAIAFDPA